MHRDYMIATQVIGSLSTHGSSKVLSITVNGLCIKEF